MDFGSLAKETKLKKADLIIFSDTILTCRGNGRPKILAEMNDTGVIRNGCIAVKDGRIAAVGVRNKIVKVFSPEKAASVIEAGPYVVMPGFIDSHTHPVFAGSRVGEFIMRAQGATYQEIHEKGGGISFTVDNSVKASFEELYKNGRAAIERMIAHGTTVVEAKSGYGLSLEEELRQLRVIKKLAEDLPVDVISTFLGAHAVPRKYVDNRNEYVRIIIEEMLPAVKSENLAKFTDVFCEEGAFTLEETKKILSAAASLGFKLKIHAEEFTNTGSAITAAEMGSVSADHLLRLTDQDIQKLAKTSTILTLMPGTLFFLGYNEYAPARRIIDLGAKVALATDYNAGSCLSASMQMAMSLACIKMKMTPEEAINAATYNAAFAADVQGEAGSIEEGKKADILIMNVEDYRMIPYHFGENLVKTVIKNGKVIV